MRIAILTSGGDAPGMNVAIRALVRYSNKKGYEVFGVRDGFFGLVNDYFEEMTPKSVSGIISKGGTILRTRRYPEFKDKNNVEIAANNLLNKNIKNLIVIGGDGSFKGASNLVDFGINIIGIPATIDNDIFGTDYTIGFHTALNTIVEAVDKLRDTSVSHQRCSIVEVMGRDSGDLALYSALSGGAEFLITPENKTSKDIIINELNSEENKDRTHAIVLVAEKMIDVHKLANEVTNKTKFRATATILGHVQRGGSPVPYDRMIATRFGVYAINLLEQNITNVAVGIEEDNLICTNFNEIFKNKKSKNYLYELIKDVS